MQDERKRILEMVEKGIISAQEALTLLEALEKEQGSFEGKGQYQSAKEKDFAKMFQEEMRDFRNDLSQLGSVFVDVMNTAVKKVKEFDVKQPFGEKYEFTHVPVLSQQEVHDIDIDLPNGSVTIVPAETDELSVAIDVKTMLVNGSEAETRGSVLNKLVLQNENGKLSILSDTKLTQLNATIALPVAQLNSIVVRLINGGITLRDLTVQKLTIKTLNGAVKGKALTFDKIEVETSNGSIELRELHGREVEAETMNGRIYVDGVVDDVEAKSINGHVIVTTATTNASKVEAQSLAGSVEIYVPRHLSISGRASTNFGKLDVGITDVTKIEQQEQFLAKTVRFEQVVEGANKLFVEGESKTGSVLVRYTHTPSEVTQ